MGFHLQLGAATTIVVEILRVTESARWVTNILRVTESVGFHPQLCAVTHYRETVNRS